MLKDGKLQWQLNNENKEEKKIEQFRQQEIKHLLIVYRVFLIMIMFTVSFIVYYESSNWWGKKKKKIYEKSHTLRNICIHSTHFYAPAVH